MKNVLLTGGTGLVGTDILNALVSEGYRVFVISRKEMPACDKKVVWIRGDISNTCNNFFAKLPCVDIVIHAGAAIQVQDKGNEFIENEFKIYNTTNMKFSEDLFEWCTSLKNNTPVLFFSGFSFLQKPLMEVIDESHPIAPLTLYAISKYWSEMALFKYSGNSIRYRPISFRIPSPVSFNFNLLHDTVVKKWISRALEKEDITIFGKGERSQDFVATVDIAQAVVKAISCANAKGIYNIASGTSISMKQLADIIAVRYNCKIGFYGSDINENDRWNILIEKSKRDFGYTPTYNSIQAINKLLDCIVCG
jgi:UDP-glucose 4-epimerase